jgi:hypothetical protein
MPQQQVAQYQIINLDTNNVVETQSLPSGIKVSGSARFSFGPMGNLLTGSNTTFAIGTSEKVYNIGVTSATGMVQWTLQN